METFASILLNRWRQFGKVELDLTPRLCVLTGPNGCGKTTVLNVLGRHFGWNTSFLSASFVTKEQKRVYADAWDTANTDVGDSTSIGTIKYAGGAQATIKCDLLEKARNLIDLIARTDGPLRALREDELRRMQDARSEYSATIRSYVETASRVGHKSADHAALVGGPDAAKKSRGDL